MDAVGTGRCGAFMPDVRAAVTVWDALSVARTVKVLDPAAVGVPETVPPVESVNPAGSVPLASAHVYGGVPPDAASAWE